MNYTLRPYQQQAVSKLQWSHQLEGADVCVLPTGSGKSLVISGLAKQLNQPILILQPTKEILEQNVEKMRAYVQDYEIGIYSASMNRKELGFYTFATIQSIYKKPEIFRNFKTVIIDECHLVNPKNLDGMFTSFLRDIDNPKVIGLTATPYRMAQFYEHLESGTILTHTTTKLINRIKEHFWHRIVVNVTPEDLISLGYWLPPRYIDKSVIQHEDIPTNISRSDFDLAAFEARIKGKQDEIIDTIFFGQELGRHVLVFCSSVEQANNFNGLIDHSAVVTAQTSKKERERIIREFRSGVIQTVFNVGVLTTGFDFPELDCIILLRPTQSIGLYSQMIGRGVRPADGKKFCNVVDLTGTVKRLGRVETIRVEKQQTGWELISEMGSWHNRVLYSFEIKREIDGCSGTGGYINPFPVGSISPIGSISPKGEL